MAAMHTVDKPLVPDPRLVESPIASPWTGTTGRLANGNWADDIVRHDRNNMMTRSNSDPIFKVISVALGVLGLTVGVILGITRHHGAWTIGIALAGCLVGWLTGIELVGYIVWLKGRKQKQSEA
jgi:hypothetical protein